MLKFSSSDIRDRVFSVEELSTLPVSVARILAITQEAASTALDLAAEIVKDPALTMKVLRTVNSSFYGFGRRIQTVSDAVILLGFTEVERLALAISVINLFGGERERARTLTQLWRHSLATSIAADVLREVNTSRTHELAGAHVAGLLHDVGKAAIGQCLPEVVPEIMQLIQHEGLTAHEAEQAVLDGVTHCEIGGWLAEAWSLPLGLVESILFHHTPEKASEDQILVHVTHLADVVCYDVGLPAVGGTVKAPTASPQSLELLLIDDAFLGRVDDRLQKQRSIIGAIAGYAV